MWEAKTFSGKIWGALHSVCDIPPPCWRTPGAEELPGRPFRTQETFRRDGRSDEPQDCKSFESRHKSSHRVSLDNDNTLEEREKGLSLNVMERQFVRFFENSFGRRVPSKRLLFTNPYGPWVRVIQGATQEQVREAHAYLRDLIKDKYSQKTAVATRIALWGKC